MDPPKAAEVETKTEKTDVKEHAKNYACGLCDTEVVYKIAQELLPGLASACVDNTTGGLFTSAGSVAADMRKDMSDYLTQRSETYVAEFLLSENTSNLEISEHPYDIILNLIDDFTSSKTNMFSRVSEWVLSDRREDRIDDFVQEMEINSFWLLARRECIASLLLKNVDYKNAFHCDVVCSSEEEVVKHRSECKFRPMNCTNEGCTTRFCAAQKEHHEAVCPFMILPCDEKCSAFVMRREMDRHCVSNCPMRLVNCAFYTVGCKTSIPRCNVQQHNVDELSSHLLYIIRAAHKEAADEDLKHRVEQIRKLSNAEKLAKARDARALTYLIKDVESKLGPLEVKTKPNAGEATESLTHEDSNRLESPIETDPDAGEATESPTPKDSNRQESPIQTDPNAGEATESPIPEDSNRQESPIQTGPNAGEATESPILEDSSRQESPVQTDPSVANDSSDSPNTNETRSSTEQTAITEDSNLPTNEVQPESSVVDSPVKLEKGGPSSLQTDEHTESLNGTLDEQSQRDEEDTIRPQIKEKVAEPIHSPKKETTREASTIESSKKEKGEGSSQQRVKTDDASGSDEEEMMSPSEYHDS